ncbi:isocitrate lyase/phosphoenolpyruvate mutase family protein [Novosphingobium sp.]|uniref:isocitrate lyase/PEP mutase family protein n=1 Tax=Novosphingobium sp. TaxID=1874826 RepID=UPI0025D04F55|nr:isocitrate lyase/phosphoenolpyruvate mutase family protein [Novosphingobium sp.]
MSAVQASAYRAFRALHEAPEPFVLANAWDAASAIVLREAGFQALATSSAAIAHALGRADVAHAVSRDEAVANGTLIARISGLPVNGDLEDGFGPSPEDCAATVEAAIAGGLAGLGIEDTTANPDDPIHGFETAVARVAVAAKAAKGRILLTGRTDIYLHGRLEDPLARLDEAIRRLTAFADAGADVLYAPCLPDLDAIRKVVAAVAPKPVNVLIGPWGQFVPMEELAAAGVKRVSLGSALFSGAMGHLGRVAARVAEGDLAASAEGMSPLKFNAIFGD